MNADLNLVGDVCHVNFVNHHSMAGHCFWKRLLGPCLVRIRVGVRVRVRIRVGVRVRVWVRVGVRVGVRVWVRAWG